MLLYQYTGYYAHTTSPVTIEIEMLLYKHTGYYDRISIGINKEYTF